MKTIKLIAIGIFLSLNCLPSGAQEKISINEPNYNKPKLFEDLPQKINVKISDMESLFDVPAGTSVIAKLTPNFNLKGTVMSKSGTAESSVRSVVVKAINRQGAVLTLTKITTANRTVIYKGRVLSKDNSDALELVKENDQYIFQKKHYNEIIAE
jgi:hypothetical protein